MGQSLLKTLKSRQIIVTQRYLNMSPRRELNKNPNFDLQTQRRGFFKNRVLPLLDFQNFPAVETYSFKIFLRTVLDE